MLAFTYIFKDPKWIKKILIGGILMPFGFLIIPALFLNGYFIRTIRHVSAGETHSLPEWNDWKNLLVTGFKYAVVGSIYSLAMLLVIAPIVALPFIVVGLANLANRVDGLIGFAMVGSQLLFQGFLMVVALAFNFWFPAVDIRLAEKSTIRSCFEFKKLYHFIRTNIKDYIIVVLALFGINYVGGLGIFLLFVGVFFTSFYAWLVGAHLKGQLLRKNI